MVEDFAVVTFATRMRFKQAGGVWPKACRLAELVAFSGESRGAEAACTAAEAQRVTFAAPRKAALP
jgi:hypothetical protein